MTSSVLLYGGNLELESCLKQDSVTHCLDENVLHKYSGLGQKSSADKTLTFHSQDKQFKILPIS